MFTTYPQNHESLYSELIYNYVTDTNSDSYDENDSDVTIYIKDALTENTLGVKRFYSTSTATINVAPIVRSYAYPSVVTLPCGFLLNSNNNGTIQIVVEDADGVQSEERIFTLSRSSENEVGLLSVMPATSRCIILGESELLTFKVDPDAVTTLKLSQYGVESDEAVVSRTYINSAQSSGFATFNLVADDLCSESGVSLDTLELIVTQNDAIIAEVRYVVVDSPLEPTRLAWISSRGTIEHYTFPVVNNRTYSSLGENVLSISSAYETYGVRRALAEIVEAPKVWIARGDDGYQEVVVESETVELAGCSEIGCVELKISYRDE